MKRLYFLMMALVCCVVANAWTVNFTNPNNWTSVNIHAWNGSTPTTGNWPGKAMTKNGDVWTYSQDGAAPANVIFNNGSGAQTSDLKFVDNATYDMNGVIGGEKYEYKVYFDNSTAKWSTVNVYTFSPALCGGWPGTKMTLKSGSTTVYEYTFTTDSETVPSCSIIFNNGSGSQTANLTYNTDGATYNEKGLVGATEETYTIYFENNAGWDNVYVYTWNPEVAGYPGVKLEQGADGKYVWNYKSTVAPSFGGMQFNNGLSGDAELKTDDLTYEVGKTYENAGSPDDPTDFTGWWCNLGTIIGGATEWTNTGVQVPEDGIVEFDAVLMANDFEIKIWDGKADSFYGDQTNAIALDTWQQTYVNGGHMKLAEYSDTQKYIVKFNCNNNMIYVEKATPSAVETMAVEAGEAIYFNMQGVRVANPENGLFIRVQNGKAVKVVK